MHRLLLTLALASALFMTPDPAAAYVGPGAGLGALGALIALLGAVALAIVGFVWFPIKRLLKRRKSVQSGDAQDDATQSE